MDPSTLTLWKTLCLVICIILPWFIQIPIYNANSAVNDREPHFASSDVLYTVCQCLCYDFWPFLCPAPQKVAGYYVIPSEILSVRPSVSAPTIRLPATPPTVSRQSFSNFTGAFRMVWRYAYCFFQNPEIIFYYIFFIFNLDIFRALILQ